MSLSEIRVSFPGGFRVDAEYKGFVIRTDQPVHEGGEGSAPAPFDLFLASLATCAGYYALAFCKEREIPVERAGVTMRMEKNPETKMIGKISIELDLPADFPEKYRKAIVRAVDRCTVKLHILHPPAFEIAIKTPG